MNNITGNSQFIEENAMYLTAVATVVTAAVVGYFGPRLVECCRRGEARVKQQEVMTVEGVVPEPEDVIGRKVEFLGVVNKDKDEVEVQEEASQEEANDNQVEVEEEKLSNVILGAGVVRSGKDLTVESMKKVSKEKEVYTADLFIADLGKMLPLTDYHAVQSAFKELYEKLSTVDKKSKGWDYPERKKVREKIEKIKKSRDSDYLNGKLDGVLLTIDGFSKNDAPLVYKEFALYKGLIEDYGDNSIESLKRMNKEFIEDLSKKACEPEVMNELIKKLQGLFLTAKMDRNIERNQVRSQILTLILELIKALLEGKELIDPNLRSFKELIFQLKSVIDPRQTAWPCSYDVKENLIPEVLSLIGSVHPDLERIVDSW